MFIKWIVCEVDRQQHEAFHEAQVAWYQIRAAVGLIAQVGGWNTIGGEACILAFWEDRSAYERFFRFLHDSVTCKNFQSRTYSDTNVALADGLIRMRGAAPTLATAAREARFLRVADCHVKAARRNHFVDAQLSVWEPGMAEVAGHLGGVSSAVEGADERFLVTTLWRNEASHDCYVQDTLPGLKRRAPPESDVLEIVGLTVRLEQEWTVLPYSVA